jgi:hypothetical protein
MIHDPDLLEAIQALPCQRFSDHVYRATGVDRNPTAFSLSGGRWAPTNQFEAEFAILYTCLDRNGALAELGSYLSLLTPVPRKPLKVHTLAVEARRTLKLAVDAFGKLGIEQSAYNSRDYEQTQRIGAAINFLEYDGLIAPSARWPCQNLMLFEANYSLESPLEIVASEQIEHKEWQDIAPKAH